LNKKQPRDEINWKIAIRPLINPPITIKLLNLYKPHPGYERGGERERKLKREERVLRQNRKRKERLIASNSNSFNQVKFES
jgi:hypothetical protein